MRKSLLLLVSAVFSVSAFATFAQGAVQAKAQFKTSGRTMRDAPSFRTDSKLRRVPTKAQVYGNEQMQGQGEVCPSVPAADTATMAKAPRRAADGERKAQALLIYNETDKKTNRIIELPIKAGAVESFPVVADKVPKMPYKNYGEAVVTALAFDDKYMTSTYCDMLYSQTNSIYTTADWKHQYDYDYRVADLETTAIAYNNADGIVYGVFQGINPASGNDEWFFGKWIDPSSYTQPVPISWLGSEAVWYGLAISPQGVIYAIDGECNLLKVDKTTGATTLVGSTGLSNQYETSACYDAVNDRILFATSLDMGSAMNSIDPATGRATTLYVMPDGEQVLGLFIPDALAADKAPAAATNLVSDFPLGSLTGAIKFDVPATYFDGTPAQGSVNYEIAIDGEIVSTGKAGYGTTASASITVTTSNSNIVTVRLSNDAGKSPYTRATLFCGTPQPRVPSFTKSVTYDDTEKCFNIEWTPNYNTSGMTGGNVVNDDLTYELVRYPDKKVITTGKGVLSVKDSYTPPTDNFEVVYYELCAVYHGSKSYYTRSNPTTFGIITPPFADEMMNNTSGAIYSYISTESDTNPWSYISGVTQQEKHHGWMYHGMANSKTPMDSYLLLAPMKLQKGKVYTLAFTAACTNTSWRNERLGVYMGKEPTVSGVRQQTLIEPTLIYERREENGERHTCNFSAPEDGTYYIAFHHNSDPNLRYLYIGDISVSAPVDGQVPAEVGNLKVVAAPEGKLSATISFDMPVKSVNGDALKETSKVRILRNDEQIADLAPTGSTCTYTDNNAANGVNNYVVVPYNSKGDGLKSMANVFVGVGKPSNPTPHAWYGDNDGQALVKWQAVTADEFGTKLTNSNVRYEIQRETILSGSTDRKVIAENIVDTQFADQYCDAKAEQSSASYWVRSVTDGGHSQWVSTRKVGLGKPYTTPWVESFANRTCEYNWHTIGSSMTWLLVGDDAYDDVKSVDGDNGFFLCQAASPDTPGLVYSGCIEVPADMESPVYSFYYLNQDKYQGVPVQNVVEMVVLDSEGQQHLKSAVCNGPWGWERMAYDMSKYKGQKVQVGVYMECVDRPFIALDAFRLATRLDHDIDMVRLSGPEEVAVGQDATLTLTYENLGATDIPDGYKLQLYRGDELVDELEGKALKADSRTSVNFTVATNPTLGETAEFHVMVKYDADDNADNNTSNLYTLKITNNIGYPSPENLLAERAEGGVKLTWSAPDMTKTPRQTYTEDFEGFDSFAKEIAGWTILDEDKGIVSPISNYIQTPESWGSPFGFFVQDNSVAPFSSYEEFKTVSGSKYMASQLTADENGNSVQNDDWLISPELSGDRQIASFMGKSISSSWPESFEVYYSMGGKSKDDFVLIGGVTGAPSAWVNYTATLPEGARYFAIRCTSYACLQFMVDDVTLRLQSCDPIELTMQGYNIYRDGKLVNDTPVSTLDYTDADADNSEHTYMVTTAYKEGESTPSEASVVAAGVEGVATVSTAVGVKDGMIVVTVDNDSHVEIYGASGICMHRASGSCSVAVPAGVYVVRIDGKVTKVIVE